jgi:hypothetical protein
MVDLAGVFLVGAKLTENAPIHFLFYNKNIKDVDNGRLFRVKKKWEKIISLLIW